MVTYLRKCQPPGFFDYILGHVQSMQSACHLQYSLAATLAAAFALSLTPSLLKPLAKAFTA